MLRLKLVIKLIVKVIMELNTAAACLIGRAECLLGQSTAKNRTRKGDGHILGRLHHRRRRRQFERECPRFRRQLSIAVGIWNSNEGLTGLTHLLQSL